MKPLILVNFKTYEEGTGKKALELAKLIDGFKTDKYQLAVAVQSLDLKEICSKFKIKVFAQHMDAIVFGAHTGSILPEAVKEAGAEGVLINHSEKRISLEEIKKRVEACKRVGLKSMVCADNLKLIKEVLVFSPELIAYEPAEFIGTTTSVVEMRPEVIKEAVKLVRGTKTKLVCGAGVNSREDIFGALKLGTEGVLIASKIVKAKEPKKVLKELLG